MNGIGNGMIVQHVIGALVKKGYQAQIEMRKAYEWVKVVEGT